MKSPSVTKKPQVKPQPSPRGKMRTKTEQSWNKTFRIPDALLAEACVRRVNNAEARGICDLRAPADSNLSGIVFPYLDRETGVPKYMRLRRDEHDEAKGEGKYHASSKDRERILYCIPGSVERLKSKHTTIVLVEAEKSALALEAYARRRKRKDIVALAMGGCQGWRSKEHGVLPDLDVCNGRSVIILLDANVRSNPQVHEAQDGLSAELRSRKCEVMNAELPQIEGVNGPDDLLAQPDGDSLLDEVLSKASESVIAPHSEHALSERFASENKDEARYVPGLGWHVWDGSRWQLDECGKVELKVQELCRTAAAECAKLHEQNRIRSRRTREAVLREAQVHLSIRHDALDKNVMLLNAPGGTVDLLTGKMRAARREDNCTKLAGVVPESKNPVRWQQFLREITQGDKKLESYMQRVVGYILTGSTIEHALFFLHGSGANGKSVFVSTLLAALGDYARTAPMEAFVVSHHPQHATSIAALRGARLVVANETEDGSRWAESKLKELTGGTPITARFMRMDEFSFVPQLKLMISGNHKPRLRNVDIAMRRRLHLIPFTAYFPEEKRDPKLAEKLHAELGGILQWAIDGCLAWQREGLLPPKVVVDATAEYFESMDSMGIWLDEGTVSDKHSKSISGDLYRHFKGWCELRGEYVPAQREFTQKLVERGFALRKLGGQRCFIGLALGQGGAHRAANTITPLRVIKMPKFAARR